MYCDMKEKHFVKYYYYKFLVLFKADCFQLPITY